MQEKASYRGAVIALHDGFQIASVDGRPHAQADGPIEQDVRFVLGDGCQGGTYRLQTPA